MVSWSLTVIDLLDEAIFPSFKAIDYVKDLIVSEHVFQH